MTERWDPLKSSQITLETLKKVQIEIAQYLFSSKLREKVCEKERECDCKRDVGAVSDDTASH